MTNEANRELSPSDDIDDLFDYDVGLDEIFQETSTKPSANASKVAAGDGSGLGLGLDEEVKVTKKRQPVAKLDESRLLSQCGIPKLRSTAKSKLKFKGKGHEFSDAARLLNFYQLWLDDMFPRAKFADGLAMIEKLGHSKRLQAMRREWIYEEKPKRFIDNVAHGRRDAATSNKYPDTTQPLPRDEVAGLTSHPPMGDSNERDNILLQQLCEGQSVLRQRVEAQQSASQGLFMSDDEEHTTNSLGKAPEDDDELDALLREQEDEHMGASHNAVTATEHRSRMLRETCNDELEAMEELGVLGFAVT